MAKVQVKFTERDVEVIRSIVLDAIDSPKYSLTLKRELDDLRAKLLLMILEDFQGDTNEKIGEDIFTTY